MPGRATGCLVEDVVSDSDPYEHGLSLGSEPVSLECLDEHRRILAGTLADPVLAPQG